MNEYREISFPRTRIATFDVFEIGRKRHHITALLELDVTDARAAVKAHRSKTGEKVSFTAWLIATISRTINEHPAVHAYLKNNRKKIVFDDVDVSMTVERIYDGVPVPLPYVVRRANRKSFSEITEEISNAKNQEVSENDVVLGEKKTRFATSLYYMMPRSLRLCVWKHILRRPMLARKLMGTVMVTAVGMFGKVNGWFITAGVHPVSFGVGSVIRKPKAVKDSIEIREILNMTVLIDHDVIDGAPMARFISDLTKNIETAFGL